VTYLTPIAAAGQQLHGRCDRHQGSAGVFLELVADGHRERAVDLQLDQPVRFVPGDDVAVGEPAAEEPCGPNDGRSPDERAGFRRE
jgi:hypothetical protein